MYCKGWHSHKRSAKNKKKMEAQDFIRREKVSHDDRLKRILPTSHTVEMKEQVKRHITLLEKRLAVQSAHILFTDKF